MNPTAQLKKSKSEKSGTGGRATTACEKPYEKPEHRNRSFVELASEMSRK